MYAPSPRTIVGTSPPAYAPIRVKCIQRWSVGLAIFASLASYAVGYHGYRTSPGRLATRTVVVHGFGHEIRRRMPLAAANWSDAPRIRLLAQLEVDEDL